MHSLAIYAHASTSVPLRTRSVACCTVRTCFLCFSLAAELVRRTRKREMGTRDYSSARRCRRCRIWWAPTPAAAVLVLLLVISSSHVADGVRITPLHGAGAGASGPGDAASVLDASSRATYNRPAAERATDQDEAAGSSSSLDQQLWWLKERAATGSRLPDCGHACGPCSPCRRVIVSFRCAMASESCPIAYRCMCRGRFFRVPSL